MKSVLKLRFEKMPDENIHKLENLNRFLFILNLKWMRWLFLRSHEVKLSI